MAADLLTAVLQSVEDLLWMFPSNGDYLTYLTIIRILSSDHGDINYQQQLVCLRIVWMHPHSMTYFMEEMRLTNQCNNLQRERERERARERERCVCVCNWSRKSKRPCVLFKIIKGWRFAVEKEHARHLTCWPHFRGVLLAFSLSRVYPVTVPPGWLGCRLSWKPGKHSTVQNVLSTIFHLAGSYLHVATKVLNGERKLNIPTCSNFQLAPPIPEFLRCFGMLESST